MTEDERDCLVFLDDKMHASGAQIGEAIAKGRARSHRGYARIGNKVARGLWLAGGKVTWLPDVCLWRITPEGRRSLLSVG